MFKINILVNGNKCKQYHFENKTFIEAKNNSQFELEIKNNTYKKVLAITSVDGINVVDGKQSSSDDVGYIIQPYSPLKIKGFRYSNDEVAAFKFVNKNESYAESIGGSEFSKNCGVIGFKIFNEVEKFKVKIDYYRPPINIYPHDLDDWMLREYERGLNDTGSPLPRNPIVTCCNDTLSNTIKCCSMNNFDMGSTWGQKMESKVVETEFERGLLAYSLDIFYASKNALIDMGIPINTKPEVSFPTSFPKKYATPPPNWKG